MKSRLIAALTVLGLALFGATNALAQVQVEAEVQVQAQAQSQAQAEPEENPTAGVARISLIHGNVSTQRGDSGDWAAAALNAPIVNGDKVSTGDRSRAEVQLDFANILRLDGNSQATIAGLTRTQIQVQVGQGTANYDVFKQSEADIEIDTPNVAVHPANKDGSFRIEVRSDGDTIVIVRKGEAEISTPKGSEHVEKGHMITVRGSGDATEYFVAEAPSKDDWDRWNGDRDNIIHNAQAWQHTNTYYTGSEDLDAYGRWSTVPDYGSVWIPAAGPGWAPYRDGRWVWEPYWGWTWVSYEPWGWAPYHYGRWFMYGSSWAWWPGPVGGYGYGYGRRYRPIWAPAYVSFFGFGGGVGVGFGFGSVGWLPIGPCDYYNPWWGRGRGRFGVVNVTNINVYNGGRHGGFAPLHGGDRYSNIRFVHDNDRIRAGLSTVPANGFGTGHFRPEPVSRDAFRDGRMMTGNLPVVPTRESLSVSNRAANPGTIRGGQSERFFMKNHPGGAPQPFDREASNVRDSIQRDGHFTPIHGDVRSGAVTNGNRGSTPDNSTTRVNTDGPRHSMETSGQGQNPTNQSNTGNNDSWRRSGSGGRFETRTPAQGQNPPNTNNGGNNNGGNNDGWRHSGSGRVGNQPPASTQPLETPRLPASDQSVWRKTTGNPRTTDTVDTRPNNNEDWRRGARTNQGNTTPQGTQTPTQDRGDWRHSTTTTQPQNNNVEPAIRNNGGNSSNRTIENNSGGRDSGHNNSSHSESRPPLDMRQPVVRDSSSSRGSSSGSGGSRSSGGGGGGGQSHSSSSSSHDSGSHGSGSHDSGSHGSSGRQH